MDKEKLSLVEYSTKHNVSISTLRRRIKDHSIDFIEDGGKYFILEVNTSLVPQKPKVDTQKQALQKAVVDKNSNLQTPQSEVGFSAANRMLEELKKAYTQILHEREEQIMNLKEEVSDLKTLVRILESENDRLKK